MVSYCPHCECTLRKKPKTGEHVKHCYNCGRNWFILETSRDEIPQPKRTGPLLTLEQADKVLKEVFNDNP